MDPVFLDRTGRRRRLFVAAGSAGGLLLLIAVVALVAGFTGTGPGSVPGWPAGADDRRVSRPDSAVSVRPRATRRQATTATSGPRTTAPVASPVTTAAPVAPSSTPAATPTTTNPHRRVPTHTPNPRKSKDK